MIAFSFWHSFAFPCTMHKRENKKIESKEKKMNLIFGFRIIHPNHYHVYHDDNGDSLSVLLFFYLFSEPSHLIANFLITLEFFYAGI